VVSRADMRRRAVRGGLRSIFRVAGAFDPRRGLRVGLMKRRSQSSPPCAIHRLGSAVPAIAMAGCGSADTYAPDRLFDLVICCDVRRTSRPTAVRAQATLPRSAAVCAFWGADAGGLAAALRPPAHGPRRPPATRRLVSPASCPRLRQCRRGMFAPRRADPPVELSAPQRLAGRAESRSCTIRACRETVPEDASVPLRSAPPFCRCCWRVVTEPRLREHQGRVPDCRQPARPAARQPVAERAYAAARDSAGAGEPAEADPAPRCLDEPPP
jgi:hypothetical protein